MSPGSRSSLARSAFFALPAVFTVVEAVPKPRWPPRRLRTRTRRTGPATAGGVEFERQCLSRVQLVRACESRASGTRPRSQTRPRGRRRPSLAFVRGGVRGRMQGTVRQDGTQGLVPECGGDAAPAGPHDQRVPFRSHVPSPGRRRHDHIFGQFCRDDAVGQAVRQIGRGLLGPRPHAAGHEHLRVALTAGRVRRQRRVAG